MNKPAGEDGTLRLLFVYKSHDKSDRSGKQRDQHYIKHISQRNEHRAMQQRKEDALNGVSDIKPEFAPDPFQQKASEK